MTLHLVPVTADNRALALSLRVLPGQAGFIETVEECLAEADVCALWQPVLIYDGALAVGFAMYGLFPGAPPLGGAWLDRLLIDGHYQGCGYGRAAVAALVAHIRAQYACDTVYLSVYENNTAAIRLYKRLGFAFNGMLDLNGEQVMEVRG